MPTQTKGAERAPARQRDFEHDLFLVHADADVEFVRGYLLPALGLPSARVLLSSMLVPGAPYVTEIERGIRHSRVTAVVLSEAFLADRWTTFGEHLASHDAAVDDCLIPILLDECKVPLRLEFRVALDFRDRSRWDHEAARLRDYLAQPAPAPVVAPCPYPGMRPYLASEAAHFCGRETEVDDLVYRLRAGARAIYVIGPSGSGKSSLVTAGVSPRLTRGDGAGAPFLVRSVRPGEAPVQRLAEAIDMAVSDLSSPGAAISTLLATNGPCERLLLFIDQLEEIFTLADATERRQFAEALGGLRTELRCALIFALRADFFGALMESELWPDVHSCVRIEIAPLRGAALRSAIEEPARRAGVFLERDLVERLLADAASEPGVLPLLQETLVQLWETRERPYLSLAEYRRLGEGGRSALAVAVARRADTTLSSLTPAQQAIARRILLRLVSFGEGRADTRRQQRLGALQGSGDPGDFDAAFRRLTEHRLLTVDWSRDSSGKLHAGGEVQPDPLVDLSHEALITGWPAFLEWIQRRRVDEERRRALEAKAREWVEHGCGETSLLDPVELAEARQWLGSDAATELGHGADLVALVTASGKALERQWRQRRRRRQVVIGGLAGFLVVVSALALVAIGQARRADAGRRDSDRLLGRFYQEQGRQLLFDGRPLSTVPYLVVAREKGMDGRPLRLLFGRATSNLWAAALSGHDVGAEGDESRGTIRSSEQIAVAALSPDGSRVATAHEDGTVWIRDATTGAVMAPALRHEGAPRSVVFSPDGALVVTVSANTTARVWNATTGTVVSVLSDHAQPVQTASFSPDGSRVVTLTDDNAMRVWKATTGAAMSPPIQLDLSVTHVSFSADGSRVIAAINDGSTGAWDATDGIAVTPPRKLQEGVEVKALGPDGARLVAAGADGAIRVWDAITGAPVSPRLPHRSMMTAVSFSPDGTRVITASEDGVAQVWDATTGHLVATPFVHETTVRAVSSSRHGDRVVTLTDDGLARVWEVIPGTPPPMIQHSGRVESAAFSPDGSRVVTASRDGTARLWNIATGGFVKLQHPAGTEVRTAVFSPDGSRVVTASPEGTVAIWDAATGKAVSMSIRHEGATAAAFSPDGSRVVTASWNGTAQIWSVTNGAAAARPFPHLSAVVSAAFSPDGLRVVTAGEFAARVWDATPGPIPVQRRKVDVVTPLEPSLEHKGDVLAAAFSRDGSRIVTASEDRTARVWDAVTRQPATPPLRHEGGVVAAAFNWDRSRVVTASRDRTARIWNATTGDAVTPPLVHQAAVVAASFSPDGALVVTASEDGSVRVWDAITGNPLMLFEHDAPVVAASFSPDGSLVVTASGTTARLWDIPADPGSLDEWSSLVHRCSPYVLHAGVLSRRLLSSGPCRPRAHRGR